MTTYLLAIDQGTTSTRAFIFNDKAEVCAVAHESFQQIYPNDGWVEHDLEEIWQTVQTCVVSVLKQANLTAKDIVALGITNQRETTAIWDRATGKPISRAIVWQDRRTAEKCQQLKQKNHETMVHLKTGLLLDPYFSATKIDWILNNVAGARARAEQGELAFGTIDSFLLWQLTKGRLHATDATNASRTLLYNINSHRWDEELIQLFNIPSEILPEIKDTADDYGVVDAQWFGEEIPICSLVGDQQAATVGQACFEPGMVKSTYGTGCFMLMNTGDEVIESQNRLLSTVAYRLQGKSTYGLEGSIFNAGTVVQWLRDGLGIIDRAEQTLELASSVESTEGVYLIPAFTGLGAPYWDPSARGAILGLTRDSTKAHIVRAGLESVVYQTRDLVEAMCADGAKLEKSLRVDGGMVINDWFMQSLADNLNIQVERPQINETTALGAALLAGLYKGVFDSIDAICSVWQSASTFTPLADKASMDRNYQAWLAAVARVSTSPITSTS